MLQPMIDKCFNVVGRCSNRTLEKSQSLKYVIAVCWTTSELKGVWLPEGLALPERLTLVKCGSAANH